jgi:hypothetical protein
MEVLERKVLKHGPLRPERKPRDEDSDDDDEEKETQPKVVLSHHLPLPRQVMGQWEAILYVSIAIVVCSLASSMVTFYHRERIVNWIVPSQKPVWDIMDLHDRPQGPAVAEVGFNTTTIQILFDVRQNLAAHLVALRETRPCLCMHHLRHPSNITRVRACAVLNQYTDQFYFMRNPRLIGYNKGSPAYDVLETCDGEKRLRKRATQLYVEWEDEKDVTHYAQFRQETAFCLQRVVEDFTGKCAT